ncbi:MAG: ferrous iron transport protein B [Candidatus Marinimicrobia bacterium]|jgi:ferrous iron transport protein B|nr:ferrous iron transport protein B [Candidatus Neomarinimicrobiota bacterium]
MATNLPLIALLGNPNSGKTAIFNLLTGMNQKVSNYPGITVEQRRGNAQLADNSTVEIMDMPGTYSLTPESLDEKIVAQQTLKWLNGTDRPAAIISVVDAGNLSRNLFLTSQVMELGIPVIIALNMMDRLKRRNQEIDSVKLQKMLGAHAVIPMSAQEKWGIDELQAELTDVITKENIEVCSHIQMKIPEEIEKIINPVSKFLHNKSDRDNYITNVQALRLITRKSAFDLFCECENLNGAEIKSLTLLRDKAIHEIDELGLNHRILEATLRFEMLDNTLKNLSLINQNEIKHQSRSERVDEILTHKWLGPLIFLTLLYGIFQSIFIWATIPMQYIDSGVGYLGNYCVQLFSPGILRDLLVEGIISGVGAILIFLPQILILIFFMTILEDTGYMARVAFMMDKLMNKIGLQGKSVLPLMSGYACAIPGIMATRTIDSWKERMITIMVLPLMSCSARLPVYALMIGAFIPNKPILGFLNLQGLTMVFMYFLGTVTAMIIAAIISRFIEEKGKSSFVMEMPPYRMPLAVSLFRQVYMRGKLFVKNAGKIIMAISIVLWLLASFPRPESNTTSFSIQNSYAGKIGHAIEPVIAPLGFDWKIGVGLITSFAAREVLVSTLATLYNVEDEGDDFIGITEALKNEVNPSTGLPRYTPLVALSIMVFYVYAAQCMATFAIVKNETNSWKWPLIMIAYMMGLAYIASLMVYQGGQMLGFV